MPTQTILRLPGAKMVKGQSPKHSKETFLMLGSVIEKELKRLLRNAHPETPAFERASDPVDVAASHISREAQAANLERTAQRITELTSVLRRLRDSPERFGLCSSCAGLIPAERLEIIPNARTCLACR